MCHVEIVAVLPHAPPHAQRCADLLRSVLCCLFVRVRTIHFYVSRWFFLATTLRSNS